MSLHAFWLKFCGFFPRWRGLIGLRFWILESAHSCWWVGILGAKRERKNVANVCHLKWLRIDVDLQKMWQAVARTLAGRARQKAACRFFLACVGTEQAEKKIPWAAMRERCGKAMCMTNRAKRSPKGGRYVLALCEQFGVYICAATCNEYRFSLTLFLGRILIWIWINLKWRSRNG